MQMLSYQRLRRDCTAICATEVKFFLINNLRFEGERKAKISIDSSWIFFPQEISTYYFNYRLSR